MRKAECRNKTLTKPPFREDVIPDMPGVLRGMIGNPEKDKLILDSRWSLPRALTRGGNDRKIDW